MKVFYTIIVSILFVFAFSSLTYAQTDQELDVGAQIEYQDVVYLKDGSILRGKILDWKIGSLVKMTILGGTVMEFEDQDIKMIRQELIGNSRRGRYNRFRFKEQGIYNLFSVSFPVGSEAGISVTYAIGHRFNRKISVGGGFGYEDLEINWGAQLIPIFVEGRGYLTDRKLSPYYSLRAGLGFPLKDESYDIVETRPGILLNPEIGYRFGGRDVHFFMGVGYRLQKAEYTIEPRWWEGRRDVDHLTYKRIDLKFGLEF